MAAKGDTVFTPQRIALLSLMLEDPDGSWFAFKLARDAGVNNSTTYDTLVGWTQNGWLVHSWEQIDPEVAKRPRRKLYKFSDDGCSRARFALDAYLQSLERASRGHFAPRAANTRRGLIT